MSNFQQQQQQQPQQIQPVLVYPNPVTNQQAPPNPHHGHSNGSFGTVFIVLAVIAVVSAIACLLGRLCNRRISGGHVSQKHNNQKKSQSSQNSRPKDQTRVHELARAKDLHHQQQPQGDIELGNSSSRKSRDPGDHIEFGFDNVMRSSSAAPNGKPPVVNGGNERSVRSGSRGHVVFERNGDHVTAKPHGGDVERRHDYHGGPRASD